MIDLDAHERGTLIRVRAQPNARKNGLLGERGGALRVGVTVAPEKGKANQAIAEVLADAFGCRGSALVLLSGENSRDKRFLIEGLDPDTVRQRLDPLFSTA